MNRLLGGLLLSVALLFSATGAIECTDSEVTYANSVWSAAASTSACSPYVTLTDPVYVSTPCTATVCLAVVEGVAENLPDCTYGGINNKIQAQNALTSCNGGDTEDAGSPTTVMNAPMTTSIARDLLASTTTAAASSASTNDAITTLNTTSSTSNGSSSSPTPAFRASSTNCTTAEEDEMWYAFSALVRIDACKENVTINNYSMFLLTTCDSDCVVNVEVFANALPNCYDSYESINKKEEVLTDIESCLYFQPDTIVFDIFSNRAHSGDGASDAGTGTSPPRVRETTLRVWFLSALVGIITAVGI